MMPMLLKSKQAFSVLTYTPKHKLSDRLILAKMDEKWNIII